jgi:hypothetical protein
MGIVDEKPTNPPPKAPKSFFVAIGISAVGLVLVVIAFGIVVTRPRGAANLFEQPQLSLLLAGMVSGLIGAFLGVPYLRTRLRDKRR